MMELDEGFCLLTHFLQYIPFTKEALHKQNSTINISLPLKVNDTDNESDAAENTTSSKSLCKLCVT